MIWSEREEVSVRESVCESVRVSGDVREVGHGCVSAARPNCDSDSNQIRMSAQEHHSKPKASLELAALLPDSRL